MLLPKRTKYRKVHRGRRTGLAKGGTRVQFRKYGLKAMEEGWVRNRQIEAAHRGGPQDQARRQGLDHDLPRQVGRKKPAGTRMGSGKGSPSSGWRWSSPGA